MSSNPPSKTPRLNIPDSTLSRVQANIAGTLDDVLGVFQGNHGSAIISWGTGTPTFAAVSGSLYMNLTPGTTTPSLWIKQTASLSPVWTGITNNTSTTVNVATITAAISTLTAEVNTLTGSVATLQVTQRAIVFSLIAPQMVGAGSGNPLTISLQPITGGSNEGSPAEIVYQPWSGSIVALSHTLIGNAGTPGPGTGGVQSGNAQVVVYKNGMATNAVATLSATIPITNTQTYAPGTYTFNAGDVLELWAQSTSCYRSGSSPWASNTRTTLWVQYNVS